jgi:hypothetical protein
MRRIAVDLTRVVGDVVHVEEETGRVGLVRPISVPGSRCDELAVLIDAVVPEATVHQLGVVAIVAAGVTHYDVEDRVAVLEVPHVFQQLLQLVVGHRSTFP